MRRRQRLSDGEGAAQHAPRRPSCLGARRRGEALSAIYYIGLLRFIGCSGYTDETSKIFPDDNAMRGAMAAVDFGYPVEGLRQAATLGRGVLGRTRAIATMVVRGKRLGEALQRADCEVMIRGAQRLGLPRRSPRDSATPTNGGTAKVARAASVAKRSKCRPGSSRSRTRPRFTSASVGRRPRAP